MRKLYLDIETTPHVAYVWKLFDETIGLSQLIEPTRMLSVAWSWDDEDAMFFAAEWERGGHQRMVERIHRAVSEADALIHYNGATFDERHLNREFLEAGLTPPQKYQTIDLYRTIKSKFKFASGKLEYVAKTLELRQGKLKTDFSLWKRVMDGEKAAREEMQDYNEEDVWLLKDLYHEILPWISQHPNVALWSDKDGCTRCGSTDVAKDGFARTSAGTFQRYRCKACGGGMRGAKRLGTTKLRGA